MAETVVERERGHAEEIGKPLRLGILVIGEDGRLASGIEQVVRDLSDMTSPFRSDPGVSASDDLYRDALERASLFFRARQIRLNPTIDSVKNEDQLGAGRQIFAEPGSVDMIFCSPSMADEKHLGLSQVTERLRDSLTGSAEIRNQLNLSAQSVVLYHEFPASRERAFLHLPVVTRVWPEGRRELLVDLLSHLMSVIQFLSLGVRQRSSFQEHTDVALGAALSEFLFTEERDNWAAFYYTGSVISALIDTVERKRGVRSLACYRGPSEHSLACGAIALWQLRQQASLVIVTSGMMDEFRGTLANLRDSEAKGFIVCAESRRDQWFAFQGTLSAGEDMRQVLTARGIPWVFLEGRDGLEQGLEEAFDKYRQGRGPVVILATQEVLESTSPLRRALGSGMPPARQQVELDCDEIDRVARILNREPLRIIVQCGQLDDEERQLLMQIAERSGAAIVDSLAHPGSVSKFHGGRLVPNYLGTFGLYGFSDRAYFFMHRGGRLRDKQEQCFFFLKSRIGQVATPFSRVVLENQLRIVQVTNRQEHLFSAAEIKVCSDLKPFLEALLARLNVEPEVLAHRNEAIAEGIRLAPDITGRLETEPMQPAYFTSRLNTLIEELITTKGFEYVGLYDVGRCGISSFRNISRTGPAFSGWYGRALMGDAHMAVPTLAATSQQPVLAFIGDGAKALTPDVLPSLVELARTMPGRFAPNVTIFYFINGNHSLIETYQALQAKLSGRQMQVLSMLQPDWEIECGPIRFRHRELNRFDEETLRSSLTDRQCVNFFSVMVDHNNQGDGLSRLMPLSWEYGGMELSEVQG